MPYGLDLLCYVHALYEEENVKWPYGLDLYNVHVPYEVQDVS